MINLCFFELLRAFVAALFLFVKLIYLSVTEKLDANIKTSVKTTSRCYFHRSFTVSCVLWRFCPSLIVIMDARSINKLFTCRCEGDGVQEFQLIAENM